MPTFFNISNRKGVFMIPSGATKSPTPAPPSFSNTKSLAFDGVDEYVDLVEIAPRFVTSTGDANSQAWSVSMWVNFDASANNVFIQLPLGTINRTWSLLFTASKIAFGHRYETAIVTENGSTAINSNQWNHIAVTFDGVDKSLLSSWKLFINGSPIVITTRSHFGTNDSGELTIGKIFTNIYGNNKTDEVSLFDYKLTSDNVNDIYNSGTPTDLTSLNPVAWYRMGDNSTYQTPQILMPENTNKDKVSNWSLEFDGVDDYVATSYTGNVTSLSLWFKPTATITTSSSAECLIGFQDGSPYSGIYLGSFTGSISNELITIKTTASSNASYYSQLGGTISSDWHHLAIVGTGTQYNIYLDNVNVFSGNLGGDVALINASRLDIGCRILGGAVTLPFDGNIDEVSLYTTELSASDVNTIYNGGEPTTISGATAYWKLGEQSKFTDNWLVPNSALSNYSKYSFNFDGVDDYLNIANNTTIARTQNISYSIWINLTANTRQYLVGNWNSSNGGTGISIESGDVLVFQLADGTNDSFFNSRVTSFSTYAPAGSWHHILGTFDGTDAKIYINGILRNTWTPTAPYTISGWNPFRIGWRGAGLTLLTTGKLDEIGLFDTAINLSDVWDGSGEPKDITSVSGIVSNWRMGEDATYNSSTSEWTIPDQVGSNDGTSSNTMALNTLVGEAPNYTGGGLSDAMTIEDRVGDAPNSENNAVSYNMEAIDIDNNTP